MLKIKKLFKNYVLILSRFGCIDGGKGFKYLNICFSKEVEDHRERIFSFNIKDYGLIK